MLPFLFSYCLKFPANNGWSRGGQYPERKAAGFGHDPETALVRTIMVKKRNKISRWMKHRSLRASKGDEAKKE
jgi:hypothetical protein